MSMLGDHDRRPTIACDPESGAKQAFKDECDINNIMLKYRATGLVTHLAANRGRFADVSEVSSYRDAIDMVRSTRDFFFGLPAAMRADFDNNPAFFLDFISNPANADEVARLGLEEVIEEAPHVTRARALASN